MPYDENFYCMYRKYLQESTVRRNHDAIFRLFASLVHPVLPQVMDLGCGVGEYAMYDPHHTAYVGIDLNNSGEVKSFIRRDYTALDFSHRLPFSPNAFISLFSIECCHPVKTRYALYEKIFTAFPSIRFGLASGFFYESKRNETTVGETGDIVSYQTIESPADYISNVFTELRSYIRTPSRMFGQDVIEVWKFFMRRTQ